MIYRRLFDLPEWGYRHPYGALDQMRQQMDRLMDTFNDDASLFRLRSGVFPLTNLWEDNDHFYLNAELPGLSSDQIEIQVTGRNLSISGNREIPIEENARYHRREREGGHFSRVVGLPGDINADGIDAKLENGVLRVVVPKAETAKPRQISVN